MHIRKYYKETMKIPWRTKCNPFQYSCWENPMNRGTWWAMVHRGAKSRTRLKWLSTQHIKIQMNHVGSFILFYFIFHVGSFKRSAILLTGRCGVFIVLRGRLNISSVSFSFSICTAIFFTLSFAWFTAISSHAISLIHILTTTAAKGMFFNFTYV